MKATSPEFDLRYENRISVDIHDAILKLAEELIKSKLSMGDIADIVLDYAKRITSSGHGFVSKINEENKSMVSYTLTKMMDTCNIQENKNNVFPIGEDKKYKALWGHALNKGKPFFSNNPGNHPASIGVPEGHIEIKNFLAYPVKINNEIVGLIALANSDQDYNQDSLEIVGELAMLYAAAINRKRMEIKLEKSQKNYRQSYQNEQFFKDIMLHDTNNIFHNINTTIELALLMLEEEEYDQLEDFCKNVSEQVRRGHQLISNVQNISFIERDDFPIQLKPIDLVKLTCKTIDNLTKQILPRKSSWNLSMIPCHTFLHQTF